MKQQKDQNIFIKVWSVATTQTILVIFHYRHASPWIASNFTNIQRPIYFNILTVLPQFTFVLILVAAFIKLKNCCGENYSLSKLNIVI